MEGGNIIVITGKNNVGEDDADGMIIYEKEKLPPPVVTITTPKKSPFNSQLPFITKKLNELAKTKSTFSNTLNHSQYAKAVPKIERPNKLIIK